MYLIAGYVSAQTGEYQWASAIGGPGEENELIKVAADGDDNTFVVAYYRGSLSLAGTDFPAPADNGRDIVIAKFNSNGEALWATNIAGEGSANVTGAGDLVHGIDVDSNGNLYVVGNLGSNASIAGQAPEYSDNRNFVARFSSDGDLDWKVVADANYLNDYFTAIHVTAEGDVLVGGQAGPSGLATYAIEGVNINGGGVAVDNNPPILLKVNNAGEVQWVRTIQGPAPANIATDSEGHILMSSHTGSGNSGVYLIKVNGETTEGIWTRFAPHNSNDIRDRDLGLHVKADNTIVHFFKAGTSSSIDFGDGFASSAGSYNAVGLLFHVGADGQTLAMREFVNSFNNMGYVDATDTYVTPLCFTAIDDETYYIGGKLRAAAELANGTIIEAQPWLGISSLPGRDAVLLKVDGELNISGVAYYTGTGRQDLMSVAVLSDGDAVAGGFFLNPSTSHTTFGSIQLTSDGSEEDYFLTRITTSTVEATGLEEDSFSGWLSTYPNPATDQINIEFTLNQTTLAEISLINLAGKSVWNDVVSGSGDMRIQIPVSNVSPGVYFARIQTENQSFVEKIVISR